MSQPVKSQVEHSSKTKALIEIMANAWNQKYGWNKRVTQDKVWEADSLGLDPAGPLK